MSTGRGRVEWGEGKDRGRKYRERESEEEEKMGGKNRRGGEE